MQIHGLQQAQTIHAIQRPNSASSTGPVQATNASRPIAEDQLDLSIEAQQLTFAQDVTANGENAGIRTEKVAAIRQAIADGSYETPEKLSAALDSLLDTFA
ncbi:MAG: flagellar biosynthesis anti-sigma factor FlgM [Planctomycetales bacterium]|nr:flagellar biosynthesis anti-sigma factor FlgM [Planctomycetales bacterium]